MQLTIEVVRVGASQAIAVTFVLRFSLLYLGGKTKLRLDYLLLRAWTERAARSAASLVNEPRYASLPSEESKPIKKNGNIFSNIAKKCRHIANGTFSNIIERAMAVGI